MPNIGGMTKSAAEIVKILGGVNATARFFGLKPPSVTEWVKVGVVPDERLIPKAALIEAMSGGEFSRPAQFPGRYLEIWPELAGGAERLAAEHGIQVAQPVPGVPCAGQEVSV